jgi:tetratricopeptide (TPR) repeat protein
MDEASVQPSILPEDPARRAARRKGSLWFASSVACLVAASAFAGAALRPALERWRRPAVPSESELARILEHATVDVRLGAAAPLVEDLRALAERIREPIARERVLGLWAEAALQAGRMAEAAAAEGQREALVADPRARNVVRLRRIGLAAAARNPAEASELAAPLIDGNDPALADEARLRLVSAMTGKDLRAWVANADASDPEEARRAGVAALRLLGDAGLAERFLAPLDRGGGQDVSLLRALVDLYAGLDRPRDLVRVAAALLAKTTEDGERVQLVLLESSALARAGETRQALATLEPLLRSREIAVRRAARRARYEVLRRTGGLRGEVAALRDGAERAFVALEVERDYSEAVRLYEAASRASPDSLDVAEGLREAERRRDLAERRALYEQVLAKDPQDEATRDKLLAVLVALEEREAVRGLVAEALKGREAAPEALLAVARSLRKAGLDGDAAGYLEKAYAGESDPTRKQEILFSLGDLYVGARREEDALRVYSSLAAEGASPGIRERAVAQLAPLLR